MTALVIGTIIALVAVGFVLAPLFRDDFPAVAAPPPPLREGPEGVPVATAVAALREIEFDHATGKLSETDYTTLKARYTADALIEMRGAETAQATAPERTARSGSDDRAGELAEQLILRHRRGTMACEICGPRPEADAVYCSTCGRYLPGRCGGCGADVTQAAARFCPACGRSLAA